MRALAVRKLPEPEAGAVNSRADPADDMHSDVARTAPSGDTQLLQLMDIPPCSGCCVLISFSPCTCLDVQELTEHPSRTVLHCSVIRAFQIRAPDSLDADLAYFTGVTEPFGHGAHLTTCRSRNRAPCRVMCGI